MGPKTERIVLEPPVSWPVSRSRRASARLTRTLLSGSPSSSPMSMATAVVMPWPTSSRGRAQDTPPPSSATSTISEGSEPRAARIRKSPRSIWSDGSGEPGSAWATPSSRPYLTPTASVGAATRKVRNWRRSTPVAGASGGGAAVLLTGSPQGPQGRGGVPWTGRTVTSTTRSCDRGVRTGPCPPRRTVTPATHERPDPRGRAAVPSAGKGPGHVQLRQPDR